MLMWSPAAVFPYESILLCLQAGLWGNSTEKRNFYQLGAQLSSFQSNVLNRVFAPLLVIITYHSQDNAQMVSAERSV